MVEKITPAEAIRLLDAGKAQAVDVREPDEFAVGHIPGAKLLPLGDVLTRAEEVMRAAGFSQRVHCYLGDAAELLETLEGPYDFLYLDGPKGQYLRQLKAIEQKLSPHAVIAADNVLFRGMVESDAPVPHRYRTLVVRLREYIAYVRTHYATVIYKDGDGLAVSYQLEMRN